METLIKYNDILQINLEKISERKEILKKKTNKNLIKYRPGKKGAVYKYVQRKDCIAWLDKNMLTWNMYVSQHTILNKTINVIVTIEAIERETNIPRKVSLTGTAEYNNNEEGQYIKMAETDGLKRCVVALGGFRDVYGEIEDDNDSNIELLSIYCNEYIPILYKLIKENKIDEQQTIKFTKIIMNEFDKLPKYLEIIKQKYGV